MSQHINDKSGPIPQLVPPPPVNVEPTLAITVLSREDGEEYWAAVVTNGGEEPAVLEFIGYDLDEQFATVQNLAEAMQAGQQAVFEVISNGQIFMNCLGDETANLVVDTFFESTSTLLYGNGVLETVASAALYGAECLWECIVDVGIVFLAALA